MLNIIFLRKNSKRRRSTTTEENQRLSRGKLVRSGVGGGQLGGLTLRGQISSLQF